MDDGIVRAAAQIFINESGERPHCKHGNALTDWGGNPLEPACGCRFEDWLLSLRDRPTPAAPDSHDGEPVS